MTTLQHVRPGDLITADLVNTMIDKLNDLETAVNSGQGDTTQTHAVVISSLIPISGNIRVGDFLQVLGQNFDFSIGAQHVYIDDTLITAFDAPNCSDTRLVFRVPLTFNNIPAAGKSAILTVSNATSTAQRTINLQSAMTLAGGIDVNPQGVQPATPLPNAAATFQYQLISQANLDATYNLTASITTAANQADWQSRVRILDTNQSSEIQSVHIAPNQQKTIFVRITQVPPATNGVAFGLTLNVLSTAGNVGGSSGVQNFVVGTPADQPDTTITVNVPSIEVSQGTGSVSTTAVTISANGISNLSYPSTFTLEGTYDVDVSFGNGAANWDVAFIQPAEAPLQLHSSLKILSSDLANPQGAAPKNITFTLRRNASATAGTIQLKLKRQGQTSFAAKNLQLQLG
jgi:hypothetical protein